MHINEYGHVLELDVVRLCSKAKENRYSTSYKGNQIDNATS